GRVGAIRANWRIAPADEEAVLHGRTEPVLGLAEGGRRSRSLLRITAAVLLLAVGLSLLLAGRTPHALLRPVGGVVLVMAAIVVGLGPWGLRIARDLVIERQARGGPGGRGESGAPLHG